MTVPPSIADGRLRPLDPRAVALQRIVGWIVCGSISGPLLLSGVVWALVARSLVVLALVFGAWSVVAAGLAWLAHFWPPISHRHAAYRVGATGIEIRRGVIWRSIVDVARSRVQHTDVSQGPIERHFGLATLLIYTAGTDNAEVSLHGLDHGTALSIRDHLIGGGGDDAV